MPQAETSKDEARRKVEIETHSEPKSKREEEKLKSPNPNQSAWTRQQRSEFKKEEGNSASRARSFERPQVEIEKGEDTAIEEDSGRSSCPSCGYQQVGAADLVCPLCASEQPHQVLRLLTRYQAQVNHWLTTVDSLQLAPSSLYLLEEKSPPLASLLYVPRPPSLNQVLKAVHS